MKNVLVTGATGDIGREIAVHFARCGYNVALHTFSKKEKAALLAKQIAKEYGVNAAFFSADLSSADETEKMFLDIESTFGTVDVLVNNAGISSVMMLCDTDENEWDRVMDTNAKSVFLTSRLASKGMVKNKWGRIINIGSVWGVVGASCEVAYSASKAAIWGFTKAFGKELAPSGITVNCISPGLIDTSMNSHLTEDDIKSLCDEIPVGRMGTPHDVAALCTFLASDDASYITCQNITVDGGWV